jgi:hypothetical protein
MTFTPYNSTSIAATVSSARVPLPYREQAMKGGSGQSNKYGRTVRVSTTADCFIKIGTSAVVATTSDILLKSGVVEKFRINPDGVTQTHIAAITASSTATVSIDVGNETD